MKKDIRYKIAFLLFNIAVVSPIHIFSQINAGSGSPDFLQFINDKWVEERLNKMTVDEKIAQLLMVTVYPKQDETSKDAMMNLIRKYKPGGVLVMQGSPVKSARRINEFQQNSDVPLLVAVDGEWGLSMRIDSTVKYPYAQAIGAVQDSAYIYRMGQDLAQQMKMMGIHMNFAPVADVSTNPKNPVINFRSLGEDKVNVSQKTWWLASGMQNEGVIPVAKHFPGHGDTETDSHNVLPLVSHSKQRLDEVESYPFRYLTQKGIAGIMTAHLNVSSIDNSGKPASLSKEVIDGYLKKEIGFQGLVVTDAINMKGVQTDKGNAELEAIKAGNDIVEFVTDIGRAIASVKQGLANGEITIAEIENKCRRVLAAKRWAGLSQYKPAELKNLTSRLNSPYFEVANRKLIKGSLTVLVNQSILPVQDFSNLKIASVMIGAENISSFQRMMDKYTVVDHFVLGKNASERNVAELRKKLNNYNLVIAGIQGINLYPSDKYGITDIQRNALADFVRDNNVITVFFGNAYALRFFDNIHHSGGLIAAYQNNSLTQELASQLIFGAFDATGKLPVTIDERFKSGSGVVVSGNRSFSYTVPEEVGIDSEQLSSKIDSLAMLGIEKQAYPGCQVLIAKDGNVILHKCYGFQTYENEQPVTEENLYDFASLTKVTAALPAIMKLYDEKRINLDKPFSTYWPAFSGTVRGKLPLRDFLTHQALLPASIPFWRIGLQRNGKLSRDVYSSQPSEQFSVRIGENLYVKNDFKQVVLDSIRNSKPLPSKRYVYSCLSFHIYPEIISNITGKKYEEYIKSVIFRPLGAWSLTYNPYLHYPLDKIIPTETDDFFRNERLRGFVHDEGAAVLGGVSGNAGLFGTANDLAKVFQMYLQKGYFAGKRIFSEETVNEFIRRQFPGSNNRRALGFDKPLPDNHLKKLEDAYPAVSASQSSFGHTGYTGTIAWADPDNGTLFVFLSNRVHPSRDHTALFNFNIRTAMHQAIYDCIRTSMETGRLKKVN